MDINDLFICRCFDLARLGLNNTSPNPSVGAVIVSQDNRIIGEGWTSPYGGAHGEVNAVASVKPEDAYLLASSTIYVSLEPCFHFGKTPPCVDLILRKKIQHVVIAYTDPNPKVAGQSIQKLKEHGVKVHIMPNVITDNENTSLLPFFTNISLKRPYIILKWAESANGFIGDSQQTLPISNAYAKRLVHKWRSEADAIMVGTNTTALDNPELTNRLYYGKSPMRVVLDKNNRLSKDLKIFDNSVKTRVYTEGVNQDTPNATNEDIHHSSFIIQKTSFKKHHSKNITFHPISFDENTLQAIVEDLQKQNIGTLFVEGGAQLLQNFIDKGLWDEARVFKTPTIINPQNGVLAPKIMQQNAEKQIQLFDNQLLTFFRAT